MRVLGLGVRGDVRLGLGLDVGLYIMINRVYIFSQIAFREPKSAKYTDISALELD